GQPVRVHRLRHHQASTRGRQSRRRGHTEPGDLRLMMPARLKRLLSQKPGGRFVSLEAEAWRDEGSRAPGPEAESPRDLANGVMSGMSAPDGQENLRDHPADARRGILSDGQQDVDLTRPIS